MAGWDGTWTTAADLQGRLPRNILSQVRGALAERASVVASPPTLPTELAQGLKPGTAWFAAFQSAVSNLIPKYANHQTSGGDYTGLTAIPMWTEAAMLTALSASRLPAPSTGLLVREWAWQQYKALNLLRWVKRDVVWVGTRAKNAYTNGASIAEAQANAYAAWMAASWHAYPHEPYQSLDVSESGPSAQFLQALSTPKTTTLGTLTSDVDFWSEAISPYTTFRSVAGWANGTMVLLSTVAAAAAGDVVGDETTNNTVADVESSVGTYGSSLNGENRAVAKYDVANGFTYKDWA